MKKNSIYIILVLVIIVAVIGAVSVFAGKNKSGQSDDSPLSEAVEDGNMQGEDAEIQDEQIAGEAPAEGETVTTAMYIPITEEVHLFVGEENGMVFTANFPEEIYDINGNKITKEQLKKGNVVELYGNGIMLESYPGQYPGISKMTVIEEGEPSDADKYQDIVDEFYQEPDPAEPPALNIEYTTELAIVTAMVNRGGYEWTYTDKDGLSNAVAADSLPVLQWNELLNEIKLKEPVDLTLVFTEEPEEVIVRRWSSELLNAEDIPEGEEVKADNINGKIVIAGLEGNYVYEVTGVWENGRAYYGFQTTAD